MVSLTQSSSLRESNARAEHLREDVMSALLPVPNPLPLQIFSAAALQSGEPLGASRQRSRPSIMRVVGNFTSASVASLVATAASRAACALRSLLASIVLFSFFMLASHSAADLSHHLPNASKKPSC